MKETSKAVANTASKAATTAKKVASTVTSNVKAATTTVKKAATTTVDTAKKAATTVANNVATKTKNTANQVKTAVKETGKAVANNGAKIAKDANQFMGKKGMKMASAYTSFKEGGWKEATSTIGDFAPIAGNIKGGIEAYTGKDLVTGRKLSDTERAISAAAIVGGPLAKGVKHGGKLAMGILTGGEKASKIAGKTTKAIDGKIVTKVSGKTEKHHIATDKSKKFDFKNHPAFKETGINVSKDIDNLVDLANHRGRHTNKYHQEVQDRLDAVYNRYGGTDKLEDAVRTELGKMKQELLDGKLDPYGK